MKYKINLCINKQKAIKMNQENQFKRKPETKVSILKSTEFKRRIFQIKVVSLLILSLVIITISIQSNFLFFKEIISCLSICSLLLLIRNASN